ncbi:MAG: hypothetical protein QOF29_1581 [bacterium]
MGQPWAAQVPTPPSTTCSTCVSPWRRSRLAATALRRPEAQITATARAVEVLGAGVGVVVGHVDRARDVAVVPFDALADVEHLQARLAVDALVQLGDGDGDALHPAHRPALLAPARHPARQVPRDVGDRDGDGELGRRLRVGVVAPDAHARLVVVGDPRQAGAEAAPQPGDAHRAGNVRVVELHVGADVDDERAGVLVLGDLTGRFDPGRRASGVPSHVTAGPSSASSGWGYCGSMSSSVSSTMRLTAQLRNHLWSAGTTYHGACSVDVRVIASS